ncbi:MAG: D-threonine aldolase [Alphaproteobacteria bacterium MarineAlpha4_Bin2]|nr:MAG: D-threonine aldolase [Alphaproteobacteria bacterium MarineAlpha4_Bin2]
MTTTPPAEIGMNLDEVDTPALLLDLDAFERNLDRMAAVIADKPVKLRPHSKSHKCAVIGLQQMARGAVGLCCQKVGEAEAMVAGGVPNVLVSNQIVGRPKLLRLAALAKQAEWVGVCADHPDNVDQLNEAAAAIGATINVLVEIDTGAARCGVAPGQPAVDLAKQIANSKHLNFAGLQAYQGRAQHVRSYDQRREAAEAGIALTRETVEALSAVGLNCEIVGGAGTGTFEFETAGGVHNELQAGSYAFMDADYGKNLNEDGGFFDDFEHSLFTWVTVMSAPTEERALVDAGLKALAMDSGPPTVVDMPEVEFSRASDEHGILDISKTNRSVCLGDKLKLIPGHCDPTVNLYDWYVGYRGDRVEALWPITARGMVR